MDTQRRIKELADVVGPPGGYARPEGDDTGRAKSSPNRRLFASKQAELHIPTAFNRTFEALKFPEEVPEAVGRAAF